jgi:hypothetical protein
MTDVSLSLQFTRRTYAGTYGAFPDVTPEQLANLWVLAPNPFVRTTPLGTFSVPYYVLNPAVADAIGDVKILRNIEGYDQTYNGLDINIRKRMSNNFMLNGSLVLQRQKAKYSSIDGYAANISDGGISPGNTFPWDPGMIPFLDGEAYAYAPQGSGKSGVYPYSEWQFKLSGVYQLPADINLGAFMRYQQGYPFVIFGRVSEPNGAAFNGTGTHRILLEPFGSRRFENMFTVDLQVEKAIQMGPAGKLTVSASFFNLLNSNTVNRRGRDVSTASFNLVDENLSPRAIRLGLRYSF